MYCLRNYDFVFNGQSKKVFHSDSFKSGGMHEKHAAASWNLRTISVIGWRRKETKETVTPVLGFPLLWFNAWVWLLGKPAYSLKSKSYKETVLQDLPDEGWLLTSKRASRTLPGLSLMSMFTGFKTSQYISQYPGPEDFLKTGSTTELFWSSEGGEYFLSPCCGPQD